MFERIGGLQHERDKVLAYQMPPPLQPASALRRWWRRFNYGDDSFLACSALLFACVGWVFTVIGIIANTFLCIAYPVALLAVVLGLMSLLEKETSRTLPWCAMLMGGVQLAAPFVMLGVLRWIG